MRAPYLVLACIFGIAGCGRSNIAPVAGRVLLDGKPLPAATVTFQPDSEDKNPGPGSHGKTDADGQYTLQLMTGAAKGALVGKHKVSITAYEGGTKVQSSGSDMAFRKALVPHEYNVKTQLTYEVKPEGSTSADFALKSKQ